MPFTPAAREIAAQAIATDADRISMHTADPGETGADEVTGGTPAYARKTTVWAGGVADGNVPGSAVTHDIPAGTTIRFWGLWTAAGVFRGGFPLPIAEAFGGQGQNTFTPTISAADLP